MCLKNSFISNCNKLISSFYLCDNSLMHLSRISISVKENIVSFFHIFFFCRLNLLHYSRKRRIFRAISRRWFAVIWHAQTRIEPEKKDGGCELHVHPCRATLCFRRLLTRGLRESSASYFCPDTLFPVPASISLASLPPPTSCDQGAVSLLPFRRTLLPARLCLALLLRHHQRLAITFLKRSKDLDYCWKKSKNIYDKAGKQ